jgi:hypothetical protein
MPNDSSDKYLVQAPSGALPAGTPPKAKKLLGGRRTRKSKIKSRKSRKSKKKRA